MMSQNKHVLQLKSTEIFVIPAKIPCCPQKISATTHPEL